MSERKYRQRGYQDDAARGRGGGGGDGGGRGRGRAPEREGPRGRGLGRPTLTVFRCARCGARQEPGGEVPPDATCAACGADLHTCTHCRHFDTAARWECRAEIERRVPAKAKANECPSFAPKEARETAGDSPPAEGPDSARAAFDALFDGL